MNGAGGEHPDLPERRHVVPESSDWPSQATDAIVDIVGKVRDRTTGPAVSVARGIVFGTLIASISAVGLIALVIAIVRTVQIGLEIWVDHETAVWLSYLIVGALFTVIGTVVWRMANRRALQPHLSTVDGSTGAE